MHEPNDDKVNRNKHDPAKIIEQLSSADRVTRESASEILLKEYDAVVDGLLDRFKESSASPSREYMGQFHATTELLGKWRSKEAVPSLTEKIEFALDPSTFPAGDRLPLSSYYPAAQSLAQIQGREVIEQVIAGLSQPASERRLRTSAWVLRECLGSKPATLVATMHIQGAEEDAKKKNLGAIRTLLNSDPVLLRLP